MSDETAVANPSTPVQETLNLDELMARGSVTKANLGELLAEADFIVGRSLVNKMTLIGTPLIMTGVVFRNVVEASTNKKGEAVPPRDYVSVEFTTVSEDPNKCVDGVFNDGSTGVRRQIVSYLQSKGLVDLSMDPDLPLAVVKTLPDGTSADIPYAIRLVAPRGLRVSEYISDSTGEPAETFYLS